jgi:hypothetical protein
MLGIIPRPEEEETESVAIGDLDGDQIPDLAVANYGTDDVAVLLTVPGALAVVPARLSAFRQVSSTTTVGPSRSERPEAANEREVKRMRDPSSPAPMLLGLERRRSAPPPRSRADSIEDWSLPCRRSPR